MKETMLPLIITHKNCVDGCCSQAILRSKFGEKAIYLELDHANLDSTKDKDAPKYIKTILAIKDSEVYISDFCLNTEMIDKLLQQGNKVVVLDHHESSIKYVEPFEERISNGEKLNIEIHFAKSNHCSGSMLTWQYLYPEIEPPKAVKHVSDGDIWKFEFGNSTKHFYTGVLESFGEPKDVPNKLWDEFLKDDSLTEKFINIGEPIHSKYMAEVMNYAAQAVPCILNGKKGLMVEAPKKYTSDLGNQLALKGGGFGLVYNIDEDSGVVRNSLRSVAPFNVSEIAQKFGGGGHAQASAFRSKNLEDFHSLLIQEGNVLNSQTKKIKP